MFFDLRPDHPGQMKITRSEWQTAAEAGRQTSLLSLLDDLSFEVGYYLLVLLSSGAATRWQICSDEFINHLKETPESDACAILACLSGSKTQLRDLCQEFMGLKLWGPKTSSGPNIVTEASIVAARQPIGLQVLRIHATPNRLKVLLPEEEMGNRVLRYFCNDKTSRSFLDPLDEGIDLHQLCFKESHFLRLSFGDENGDRIHVNGSESVEPFYARISKLLTTGLTINGRTYHFLAYSSSQLKAWSCWMVADPKGSCKSEQGVKIAKAIRQWMGDAMQRIKVPAKCAARLGQCLSTTVGTSQVSAHEMKDLNDVERNGHVFSDGVGRISPALLKEALLSVPFASKETSAIQVRFGGCKGVLSVYGKHKKEDRSRSVELRPSMKKFESEVRVSRERLLRHRINNRLLASIDQSS